MKFSRLEALRGAIERYRVTNWLRLLLSAALLGYVFRKVGWSGLADELKRAEPIWIAIAFAMLPIPAGISVLKWQALLRAKGVEQPFSRLFSLYMIGHFFNHLLPSNVGGDAVRSYQLGRTTGRMDEALASVFFERFTGLTVLMLLTMAAVPLNLRFLGDPKITCALLFVFTSYLVLRRLLAHSDAVPALASRLRIPVLRKLAPKLQKIHNAVQSYQGIPGGVWIRAYGLSWAFYGMSLVGVYVHCLAFGVHPEWTQILVAVPVILVITMIPISLGGIGLQEWAYVLVFELVGLTGSLGLSVALLSRAKMLTKGAFGGLLFARSPMLEKTKPQDWREPVRETT